MKFVLKGPRITLMHLEPSMHNAKLMYEVLIQNKNFLLPWMQWLHNTKSVKDTHKFLIQSDKKWENDDAYEYAIILHDTIIGMCGAVEVDKKNKKVALGYWLANGNRRLCSDVCSKHNLWNTMEVCLLYLLLLQRRK